jgi:hypothetical protein
MNSRRQAFMLAGALTATVLTAVAAVAGVSHRPATATQPTSAPIVQVAQHPTRASEWEDD